MVRKAKEILIGLTINHMKVLLKFLYENRANIKPDGTEDIEMLEIIRKLQDKLEKHTGRWWV